MNTTTASDVKTESEASLLESARMLLDRLSKLNDGLLALENRLYYQGEGKELEEKAKTSDLRTLLDGCHNNVTTMDSRLNRMLSKLGE
jgi:hypothetical protein